MLQQAQTRKIKKSQRWKIDSEAKLLFQCCTWKRLFSFSTFHVRLLLLKNVSFLLHPPSRLSSSQHWTWQISPPRSLAKTKIKQHKYCQIAGSYEARDYKLKRENSSSRKLWHCERSSDLITCQVLLAFNLKWTLSALDVLNVSRCGWCKLGGQPLIERAQKSVTIRAIRLGDFPLINFPIISFVAASIG